MQLINSPPVEKLNTIELAMQKERLLRYMPAAGSSKSDAFKLYSWNCALGEAFYISLHFSEIVCRNAINRRLIQRLGDRWFENPTFKSILAERFKNELDGAIRDETARHGAGFTVHHIVSAMTFAFWQHLLTKRFERQLWSGGIQKAFPHAPNSVTRENLYLLVESVRRWRNRIAHHQAVFDKGPMKKHQEALRLIMWACLDTGDWIASVSKVPVAISLRPA
ncbi:MAG: hypothetical protein KGQ37_01225 [Hyphomicrobiales bacterium]|nr:hypothetical protein [Hyphomicrobiales bacterium]